MLKRTPLYETHVKYGGKIIEFGDWELPVQYSGILAEHENTRTNAGLFDVSHMGEFTVKGPSAFDFISNLVTSDISKLADGQVKYSLMCYKEGGTVDDLLIYRKSADDYILVVNAANIDKDFEWADAHLIKGANLQNISEMTGEIALQGPKAPAILASALSAGSTTSADIRRFRFKEGVMVGGVECLVSRTGYTGEDGYEIYCAAERTAEVWEHLMSAGRPFGLLPVGLGARDTLRFESSMTLYGHELSDKISPLAAGLVKSVSFDKPQFIGRSALLAERDRGPETVRIGFEMTDKGIARNGYKVFDSGGTEIGFVTSGSYSPTFKKNLGMAMVSPEYSEPGTKIGVEIRDKILAARVIPMPFYLRPKEPA